MDYSGNPNHLKFQSIIDSYSQKGITGLTVLISTPENGEWIGSSGYTNIEDNQAMTPCNLHHTASLAKSFTGVITLQLIDEGKLNFNDPIAQFLSSEAQSYIPSIEKITIKHLLNIPI